MAYLIEILNDEATRQTVLDWEQQKLIRVLEIIPGTATRPITPDELATREKYLKLLDENQKKPRAKRRFRGVISKEEGQKIRKKLNQLRNEWERAI